MDALGLPVDFDVTVGERYDNQTAPTLSGRVNSACLLADQAYESHAIRAQLALLGAAAVIPSMSRRNPHIPQDRARYKARSAVECTLNLFTQANRFATGYAKTLRHDVSMVTLCWIKCWLRI